MKKWIFITLLIWPHLFWGQTETGRLAIGSQFYQNLLLPDNYQGFGVGLNSQVHILNGFGLDANYFYEALDLMNAGNIKRVQSGLAVNYMPLYKKTFSPWVQLGVSHNIISILPVSYLFSNNSDKLLKQRYFGLNVGIGAQYIVNPNLTLNSGFYYQPQNYLPNYELQVVENKSFLNTNIILDNPAVKPLLYFNIGFTYKIAKLW